MKILIFLFIIAITLQICVCAKNLKFLKTFKKWNNDYTCFDDIRKLLQANRFDEMLDSWSNFTQMYHFGNSIDFGEFDKCLNFKHEKIQPQYCLIQYQYKKSLNRKIISVPPKKTPLNKNWNHLDNRFGGAICIPSSCRVQNVKDIMKEVFNGSDFVQTNDYDQTEFCEQTEINPKIDSFLIVSAACLLIIIIFVIVGTFITHVPSVSFYIKFFQCFSMKRNFKSLMTFPDNVSQISCLNGIKAISTIGIFFMHSNLFRMVFPFKDGYKLSVLTKIKYSDFVISLLILMDTFLIVSGMLVARTLIRSEKISLWKFYFQRYMRLTSLVFVLICYAAINIFVFQMFPKPYFHLEHMMNDCKIYGWTTMLHIQTFVNPMSMCIPHAWYVSVLFQLIIIAPLIHLALKKQKDFVKILCYGIIILIGLLLRLIIFIPRKTYFDSETGVVIEMNNEIVAYTYFTPFIRVISFFSGVLLAHILEQDNKNNLFSNDKINKFILKCGFYISIIAIVTYIFVYPLEKKLTIMYGIVWIIATNFVIFVCCKGQGGIVNNFLSMKLWMPISKMGLTIYLTSPFFQGLLIITKTQPWISLEAFDIIIGFLCDAAIASLPVIFIYISIECSFTNLGKLLTNTGTKIDVKK
ncbi:hypothetical protein PVAND_009577 [Polypedilum vanderplanki]|uniref:Nose resistant-to-fluoxetine protein N-terminal domain-containing protein n=1 Tax=Polypedilum vanderplanki TaxID=319348 RepID=A0A9J6CEJ6_POLVA|nr:hypothetical protein PVAND_009577 [Polypedilum vanderplanki]